MSYTVNKEEVAKTLISLEQKINFIEKEIKSTIENMPILEKNDGQISDFSLGIFIWILIVFLYRRSNRKLFEKCKYR